MKNLPLYDSSGLHVLDPKDTLGKKSTYITILHKKAFERYILSGDNEIALDLGCGYGRLTQFLTTKGWKVIGIDPSADLIKYAITYYPGPIYIQGALPHLPVRHGSVSLLLIQNLLRALKLANKLYCFKGVGSYLAPNATVVVVENLRLNHPDFLSEQQILDMMESEGLKLVKRVPIRAARWWMMYLIRYGLIPRSWFERIAEWELSRMERRQGTPRWQYWNVLFVFKKFDLLDI